MPQVPFNRLYKVRSTARTPVPASTHIPDAAGAYLRGVLPGQRAALQIAGENAKLAADKARSRVEGIATGMQVFSDTYQAIERARERQDADDFRSLQNKARRFWLSREVADFETPYKSEPTSQGVRDIDGPLPATARTHAAFRETDDYKSINPRIKDKFDEWLSLEEAERENKAKRYQSQLLQAKRNQELKDSLTFQEMEIADFLKLDEMTGAGEAGLGEYGKKVVAWADETVNQLKYQHGYVEPDGQGGWRPVEGVDIPKQQEQLFGKLHHALVQKKIVERFEYLAGIAAADSTTEGRPDIINTLRAWGMTAEEYKAEAGKENGEFSGDNAPNFFPDAQTELPEEARAKVRALANDAEKQHERRVVGADMERAAAAQTAFNAAVGEAKDALAGDDIGSVNNAWSILQAGAAQAEAHAAGIRDETRRANFLAEVRKSVESARAAYGNDLLLRVGLGALDANQQEVARADTAALYEDAPEGMRLKALDEMDLAIATKQGDAFAREFLAAQNAGNEARVSEMLQEIQAMPNGKKKDFLEKVLFGGTARGSTGGNAPPKKFSSKDVAYLLSNGENPAEVLKQIDHAYWDRAINAEGYLESIAMVQERMTFSHAVGDKVPEYTKAVTDAMNAWLGFNSYGHTPKLDSDGNPVWVATTGKTYNTTIKNDGTRATGLEYLPKRYGGTGTLPKTITVSDETLASAFKYGLQYVIRRANGLVEGKKDSGMTPEAVMQELQAEFDEFLLGDEAIANDILRNRIERARIRQMPWNERRIAGAMRTAIDERSYH